MLEAKRLGHRAVLRLSWLLLVASVALSTLLQVAVAPPTLVGYLTAGATPVWLLGSFAVLSLLYRADLSADSAMTTAEVIAEPAPASGAVVPSSAEAQQPGAEVLTKRAQAERAFATLSATGAPVSAGQLAAAAGLSASYARALVAEFHIRPPATPGDGRPAAGMILPEVDRGGHDRTGSPGPRRELRLPSGDARPIPEQLSQVQPRDHQGWNGRAT